MKGFDVLKVKSAVKSHNKFDLSRTHLTTMDFGQIVPLFAEETVPGDKYNISADYFSRMAPLVKPTYGKFTFKTVSAFVPYYMVAEDADAWLAGKTTWEGQTPVQRHITAGELFYYINTYCATGSGATATNCDFVYLDSSGSTVYRVFTNKGRYFVKVLNALGYAIPQGVDYQTGSAWSTTLSSVKYSAYPLLAFFKLYNDYMSQSQRFNSSLLSTILSNVKFGKAMTPYWYNSTGLITSDGIKAMFDSVFLNYENDYFVSAWQTANNAINSVESIGSTGNAIPVPASSTYNEKVFAGVDDTKLQVDIDSQLSPRWTIIGQRALDFLKSFDDWVRRNNYSGSRAVQQIYSKFGVKTDDYRSHYAQVISTNESPIQIGDVTATADATGVPLGDYAGKGIMSDGKSISVNVSDFGLILILGYFTVAPMYAFGFDRKVLRTNPLDYYNAEFDGIGADAISLGEVYANPIAPANSDTSLDTSVFGFTERYNAYRYGRDVITGEFRNYHPDGDMNCWHSGRNLNALRQAGSLVAQSTSMNTLPQSDSEYNRIFSNTSGDVDHFYMTARFKVDAIRPMMNLNQVAKLGEGDTIVPRNGNVIS